MKNILIISLIVIFISACTSVPKKETKWYSGKLIHEGYPLHLRFPEKPDFVGDAERFPKLLIATHEFSQVTSSGLPEPEYNKTLADFDHEVINFFPNNNEGIAVLVETFGGKRIYYIYISPIGDLDAAEKYFGEKYPHHKLDWELRDDTDWSFIKQYSTDYNFYKNGGADSLN